MNNLHSSASAPHSQKRRTQRPPEPPLSVHDRRPLRPLRLAPLQPFSLPTRSMLCRRQLSSKSQKETLMKQRDQVSKNRRSQRPSQSSVPPPQTLRIPFQSLSAHIQEQSRTTSVPQQPLLNPSLSPVPPPASATRPPRSHSYSSPEGPVQTSVPVEREGRSGGSAWVLRAWLARMVGEREGRTGRGVYEGERGGGGEAGAGHCERLVCVDLEGRGTDC